MTIPHLPFNQQHPVGRAVGRKRSNCEADPSVRHCSTEVEPTLWRVQTGFTLLEMILVLFLIGLMASTTLMLTDGIEDQAKYDATKLRMEMMRKAIVGDPTRTVNGGPEISGFVADMGRLPGCVAELLTAGNVSDAVAIPPTYQSPCDGSEITAWHIDSSTGLGFGWRGPYLQVLPERNGELRFRDGYGNKDTSDAQNSGWLWELVDASDSITTDADTAVKIQLQSEGFDASSTYPTTGPIDLVLPSYWQLQVPTSVSVLFANQSSAALPSSPQQLVLSIYLTDEANEIVSDTLNVASAAIATTGSTLDFNLDASSAVPIGTRGYLVVCQSNSRIFDGDCDVSNALPSIDNIRTFSVAPRQNLNLDWIIQ